MVPLPPPERTARRAELALGSTSIQAASYRAIRLLSDIAAGHASDVDPDQAQMFAEKALQAVITSEILARREATR